MSSNSEILTSVSREGCILLEHHRETVASFLPTCSASHLPVLPFSTNAIFILFIFCDSIIHLLAEYNTLMFNAKVIIIFGMTIENLELSQSNRQQLNVFFDASLVNQMTFCYG